ncbi:hypothetical protein ACU8KO_002735 [Vibrio alginolyticus]
MKEEISFFIDPELEHTRASTTQSESISARIANLIPSEPATPIKVIKINDIGLALYSTSPHPFGNWGTSWVMQLKRRAERCTLPRGFGSFSV